MFDLCGKACVLAGGKVGAYLLRPGGCVERIGLFTVFTNQTNLAFQQRILILSSVGDKFSTTFTGFIKDKTILKKGF